jgi:beta-glucosidase
VLFRVLCSICLCTWVLVASQASAGASGTQVPIGARQKPTVKADGRIFHDSNGDGLLEPYEDWRLTPQVRARDLLSRMTLEEKAGVLLHGTLAAPDSPIGLSGVGYDFSGASKLILERHIVAFICRLAVSAATLAAQNNAVQEIAERSRLGVPVTISSDPRNHLHVTPGAGTAAASFSQWPDPLGLAAIGEARVVRRFADIARQEYRAVGLRETLSPQADLATEPRWPRINGTFGEDPDLASTLVESYVQGFQHGSAGLNQDSVAAVVKHWAGYGAAENGFDSHNRYGRFAAFPGGDFALHLRPFEGAFAAHVGTVMPMYSIPRGLVINGVPVEQVGGAYNEGLLTELLRNHYGFPGVILSDWAVTNDCSEECRDGAPAGQDPSATAISMAWGVESLPAVDRFAKAINAGVDQLGGTEDLPTLLAAIQSGKIPQARVEEAAARVLEQKFALGLFENPYVDVKQAARIVGSTAFVHEGLRAQVRSLVLLKNDRDLVPVRPHRHRTFLYGISPEVARRYGFRVVNDLAQADLALIRIRAPYEQLHPNFFFGRRQHEGRLAYQEGDADFDALRAASARVPTIVTVYVDRPAILTNVQPLARALIANFGIRDDALLEALTHRHSMCARLPLELPSSLQAVAAQQPDVPHDSSNPLYPIHFGGC